jgi:hypothetical protein
MIKEYIPKYKRGKTKDRFEKIKAEVQEKFEKEHTFKPTINYEAVFQTAGIEKYNESKEEVYKRLATPKMVEINKRMKEKENFDRRKMSEECTFKPNIKTVTNEVLVDNDNQARERVESRLYKLAEQMKEKREKLKRDHQNNLVNEYSFNPKIDENSKQLLLKYENKPLHERVYIKILFHSMMR